MLAKCFNFFVETTKAQRSKEGTVEFIGVFLFPSHVESLLELNLANSSNRVNYNVKQLPLDRLFKAYRDSIDILVENPELTDETIIETKLKEFVLLISKSQNLSPLDFLAAMFNLNFSEFRQTVEKNIYSNLNVDEFAQLCAMSTSTFKRKFKETFGESPRKYIAKKKLEKAVSLLKNTTERVSDIAYDSGYETISTFNRSFKSAYGLSPSAFRLRQTG